MSTEQEQNELQIRLEKAKLEAENANLNLELEKAKNATTLIQLKLDHVLEMKTLLETKLAEAVKANAGLVAEVEYYRLLAEAKTVECIAAAQISPETAQIQADAEKHRLDMEAKEANAQRVEAERQREWEAELAELRAEETLRAEQQKAEVEVKERADKMQASHERLNDIFWNIAITVIWGAAIATILTLHKK